MAAQGIPDQYADLMPGGPVFASGPTQGQKQGPSDDCPEHAPMHSPRVMSGDPWPTPEQTRGVEEQEGAEPRAEAYEQGELRQPSWERSEAAAASTTPPAEQPTPLNVDGASTDLAATPRASGSGVECVAPPEVIAQARRELQEAARALEVEESGDDLGKAEPPQGKSLGSAWSARTSEFGTT